MTGVTDPLLPCGPNAHEPLPVYPGLEKRFRLIEKMGDGAFSSVYKSIDTTTGQLVAIKAVRKYELNATQRASVMKEVSIMRTVRHPNVISLLCFAESQDYYYLILELMSGGELFHQIVRLTYFSEDLSRHVILQVAHGIRYLHEERGVVHRDIKPENLLFEPIPLVYEEGKAPRTHVVVSEDIEEEKEDEGTFIQSVGGGGIGKVKIADFGLSKVVWNEQTMTPCGTVGYTAPEIVRDERYSKSVDMWALGCVLYTLLCGFPPFYDDSVHVLTEKVARGQYTFLSPWWDCVSTSAKDLISHLLTVDPEDRYTIDEFLNHPWCYKNLCSPQNSRPILRSVDAKCPSNPINFAVRAADADAQRTEKAPSQKQALPPPAEKAIPIASLGRDRTTGIRFPAENGWDAVRATYAGALFTPLPTSGNGLSRRTRGPMTPGPMTPGGATMKEVIDVSYAVQRAEEEEALRRRHKAAFRARVAGGGKAGASAAERNRSVRTTAMRQQQQKQSDGMPPPGAGGQRNEESLVAGVARGASTTLSERETAEDLRQAIQEAVASKLDLTGADSSTSTSSSDCSGSDGGPNARRYELLRHTESKTVMVVPPPENGNVARLSGVQAQIDSAVTGFPSEFYLRLDKSTLLGRRRKCSSPRGSPPPSPTNSKAPDVLTTENCL